MVAIFVRFRQWESRKDREVDRPKAVVSQLLIPSEFFSLQDVGKLILCLGTKPVVACSGRGLLLAIVDASEVFHLVEA